MNEQLVLVGIGLVAAAFILRPLLRGRGAASAPVVRPAEPSPVTPASSDELAELELDRAMGRVSEEDYARWRRELEANAAPIGAPAPDLPATPAPAPVPAPLVMPDDATARAEALVRRFRDAPRPTCPSCGERPEAGARYCSSCGTALGA